MTHPAFTAVLYFKEGCPFCLKVRLFLLESRLIDQVEIREFAPGSQLEHDMRAELGPKLAKVTFPAAQLEPGRYISESDAIVAELAATRAVDVEALSGLRSYGDFMQMALRLREENLSLKARLAAGEHK